MDISKIEKVSISSKDGILSCKTTLEIATESQLQFAFYIFRNFERIHTEWYSSSNVFEFDTQGKPGCYHVQGFAKLEDQSVIQSTSSSIFLNALKITKEDFSDADKNLIAYSLNCGRWTFPALYYPSEKKNLFVLMPSAVNRSKSSIPAFNRWKWAVEGIFPGSVLCISDPTLELHDELELGWLLGTKENCATTALSQFVTKIAEANEIPVENIVTYGSSAGGFSALSLSACIDGSVAVAINAQVDAIAYKVTPQVDLVSKMCFGMPKESVRLDFSSRVDMTTRWRDVKNSRAFLVQNIDDWHHHNVHFKPLWASLGGDPGQEGVAFAGRHIAWVHRQEGGHVPETKEMAKKIIEILDIY